MTSTSKNDDWRGNGNTHYRTASASAGSANSSVQVLLAIYCELRAQADSSDSADLADAMRALSRQIAGRASGN